MRFMVEVVMLPVLAHYAVCWSGHPTRLAEILRVHSGLFGGLLPDACGEMAWDFGTDTSGMKTFQTYIQNI